MTDDDRSPIRFVSPATCPHHHMLVDPDQRTVACDDCGQTLDPIWCLISLGRWEAGVDRKLEEIREFRRWEAAREQRARERRARIRGVVDGGA